MSDAVRIVAIDDEQTMLRVLKRTLEGEGYATETFSEPETALEHLRGNRADLLITDLMMEGIDGFVVLERALRLDPDMVVIVITAFSSVESAVRAMRLGACDFIPKPFDPEHLLLVVQRALENRRLRRENIGLKQELSRRHHLDAIIGVSESIREVKSLIEKVKNTDATVLITGESGTGKELVARAIHEGSKRCEAPFVPINCGALPDDLLESELFGYEKGAFTGAVSRKPGLLELGDTGTVFLDEVGGVSPMMQVKLLRFLQEKSFMRLGGGEQLQVDVRILAATNEDLPEKILKGTFRKDLFYRLNVIAIRVPPLRERREDIRLLARFFLDKYVHAAGKRIDGFAPEAEELLAGAEWEGNVRELENAVERAVTLCDGSRITVEDLSLAQGRIAGGATQGGFSPDLSLAEVEALHIRSVLEATGGNKTRAARVLGIDYTTLLRKLKTI
ncbi:MAG: sigma-54 dependent transcriptional regulator [Desulfobulbaceae bacterium]